MCQRALLFLLLLLPLPALAESHTGQTLLTDLQSSNSATQMLALGYVRGVTETYNNMGMLCVPVGATVGQSTAMVKKYLEDHPESWNTAATILVFDSLNQHWACPKAKAGP